MSRGSARTDPTVNPALCARKTAELRSEKGKWELLSGCVTDAIQETQVPTLNSPTGPVCQTTVGTEGKGRLTLFASITEAAEANQGLVHMYHLI